MPSTQIEFCRILDDLKEIVLSTYLIEATINSLSASVLNGLSLPFASFTFSVNMQLFGLNEKLGLLFLNWLKQIIRFKS